MSSIINTEQQLAESGSLEMVAKALGEVAALRFKATKDQIEHNFIFFQEVGRIYRVIQLLSAKRNAHQPQSQKNNQTISVLLTSNAHFNGGLDRAVADMFLNQTKQSSNQRLVIGQSGINYLQELNVTNFTTIRLAKDLPNESELRGLVNHLKAYSRILVYYSKFVTVLEQKPDIADLSAPTINLEEAKQSFDYILEPELPQMVEFFEGQILIALFDSIFLGANLARIASRMVAMDSAEQNIDKELSSQKRALLRLQKDLKNLSIIENYVTQIALSDG